MRIVWASASEMPEPGSARMRFTGSSQAAIALRSPPWRHPQEHQPDISAGQKDEQGADERREFGSDHGFAPLQAPVRRRQPPVKARSSAREAPSIYACLWIQPVALFLSRRRIKGRG